jgi:hypothetical protein
MEKQIFHSTGDFPFVNWINLLGVSVHEEVTERLFRWIDLEIKKTGAPVMNKNNPGFPFAHGGAKTIYPHDLFALFIFNSYQLSPIVSFN